MSLDSRGDADPLFSRAHMEEYAEHYLAGHDPKDELASPLLADLTGLPPLLIQVGSAEVLLDDSLRLAVRAAEHEVDVSLNVVAGAPHVYPLMARRDGRGRPGVRPRRQVPGRRRRIDRGHEHLAPHGFT
ncbi:alpha/beta hydrolase fold domain-containing protein [Streptosporangium lutulentum]